ncbi:hypothetical protein Q3G72_032557 [Acer saccharum]|nr:hypothetical protein Q3G72_032557 [Acer saccharum]
MQLTLSHHQFWIVLVVLVCAHLVFVGAENPSPDIYIPQQWSESAESIDYDSNTSPPPIALICGAKNCGKTTFSRYLVNIEVQKSCTPERSFYFVDVSSKRDPTTYLKYTFTLYDYYQQEYCMLNNSENPGRIELDGSKVLRSRGLARHSFIAITQAALSAGYICCFGDVWCWALGNYNHDHWRVVAVVELENCIMSLLTGNPAGITSQCVLGCPNSSSAISNSSLMRNFKGIGITNRLK